MHSLYTVHPLYTHYTPTIHSPYTHCTPTIHQVLQSLFGISQLSQDEGKLELQVRDNEFSQCVCSVVNEIRLRSPVYQHVDVVVRGQSGAEPVMQYLVEDKSKGQMSYVEFLCLIHKKIQQKFVN
jgi:protein transport protein SEC24